VPPRTSGFQASRVRVAHATLPFSGASARWMTTAWASSRMVWPLAVTSLVATPPLGDTTGHTSFSATVSGLDGSSL
jgi:hypothetical protein